MADAPLEVLVDTSTLLGAELDEFDPDVIDHYDHGAIHALLFNDTIYLDGLSVGENRDEFQWLEDVDDSVVVLDINDAAQKALYARGASLAREINPAATRSAFTTWEPSAAIHEIIGSRGARISMPPRAILRRDLPDELKDMWSQVPDLLDVDSNREAHALASLSRLFYYLALQEQVGCALLLDPSKRYFMPASKQVENGTTERIFEIFNQEVAERHRERRRRWLGQPGVNEVSLPLVSGYVANEAERRGWSIGRTIVWLRKSWEVEEFRIGLRALNEFIESGDNEGVDAVLVELESTARRWSDRIGQRGEVTRLKVTVPLPFAEPELMIPIGKLRRRTPAERMLVFVHQTLRFG